MKSIHVLICQTPKLIYVPIKNYIKYLYIINYNIIPPYYLIGIIIMLSVGL